MGIIVTGNFDNKLFRFCAHDLFKKLCKKVSIIIAMYVTRNNLDKIPEKKKKKLLNFVTKILVFLHER